MFVFHHITRTGGVTFKNILNRNFGNNYLKIQKNIFDDVLGYNRNHPNGGSDGLTKTLTNRELYLILSKYDNIHCISSHHIPFPNSFDNFEVMVFLRNPLKRVLSSYFYLRDKYIKLNRLPSYAQIDFRENISMFFNYSDDISKNYSIKNYCTNYQTHVIDNSLNYESALSRMKNEFWFVGVTERFDESLLILRNEFKKINHDFNIMYSKQHVNITKAKTMRPFNDYNVSEKDIDHIIDNNQLDFKLYEEANNILNSKIKNYDGDFSSDLAFFKRKLSLWKIYHNSVPNAIKNSISKFRIR